MGGVEEKNQAEAPQTGGAAAPEMPPEEPTKMEDIVTGDVLQEIIKGYNKPDLTLVSFNAQTGSNVGDNYVSIMYALEIQLQNEKNGETESLHVMLKTIPRNAFRIAMINETKAFVKEASIYQQVLPMLVETQEGKEMPSSELFCAWPICYASHVDGATDYLALENLKVAGFKMGSRTVGLDFNHCNLVLRNLAKYHAISFAKFNGDREKILEFLPILSHSMFNNPESKVSAMQKQYMEQSLKTMATNLRGEGHTEAAARLEKLADSQFGVTLNSLIQDNIEYAVVTHGDCWVNNILFSYDGSSDSDKSSSPTALKFLDFQQSLATSRFVDIFYFLMTSAQLDIVNEREQDLLLVYYAEFTSFAQRLGINTHERGLTWENFLKEADHFRLFGVFTGLLMAPMMAANAEDIPDMETMTEDDFTGKNEESTKKFMGDIFKGKANQKVECLLMKHLPKCNQGADYCSQ